MCIWGFVFILGGKCEEHHSYDFVTDRGLVLSKRMVDKPSARVLTTLSC